MCADRSRRCELVLYSRCLVLRQKSDVVLRVAELKMSCSLLVCAVFLGVASVG